MTYEQALSTIHEIPWKSKKPGLNRITELMHLMGDPQKKLKYIHIAGSNGKGSCAAMISSILTSAGYKTGLCISPYIHRFNERMQINSVPIADNDLAEITEYVKTFADQMAEYPTEFEFVTAITLEYFSRNNCEIVVIEVGLGGKLDATNVIPPPVAAVIMAIGMEHTEILGDTLEKIAREKAGIIKPGSAGVVISDQQQSVINTVSDVCQDNYCKLIIAKDLFVCKNVSSEGQVLINGEVEYLLPLLGAHQRQNLSTVLKVIEVLKASGYSISDSAVYEGVKNTKWPGRFEFLQKQPPFIIDGGHNPQCSQTAAATLRELYKDPKVVLLAGVLKDKDVKGILDPIMPMVKKVVTITPPSPRAMQATELSLLLSKEYGVKSFSCTDIKSGINKALSLAEDDEIVLAYGSLYSVGEIREYFSKS